MPPLTPVSYFPGRQLVKAVRAAGFGGTSGYEAALQLGGMAGDGLLFGPAPVLMGAGAAPQTAARSEQQDRDAAADKALQEVKALLEQVCPVARAEVLRVLIRVQTAASSMVLDA